MSDRPHRRGQPEVIASSGDLHLHPTTHQVGKDTFDTRLDFFRFSISQWKRRLHPDLASLAPLLVSLSEHIEPEIILSLLHRHQITCTKSYGDSFSRKSCECSLQEIRSSFTAIGAPSQASQWPAPNTSAVDDIQGHTLLYL